MATSSVLQTGDLVSVIIPCFNARPFVEEAIRSAYAQSHRPLEVIVVDDGSTDGSWELLQELQQGPFPELLVLSHPNRVNLGVSCSRALGARKASGDFLAFLDSDDLFLPNKLKAQLSALSRHPEAVLCHTAVEVIGDMEMADYFSSVFNHGQTCQPYDFRQHKDYLIRHGICNSSVLIRRSPLQRVSLAIHRRSSPQFEDWLCWALLGEDGPFLFLEEILVRYRAHSASFTSILIQRRLDQHFALLEFKLALLARCRSTSHALRVLFSLAETLRQLIVIYMGDPSGPPLEQRNGRHSNGVILAIMAVGKPIRWLHRKVAAG
ncbi:glycosyltransferase family 2 protein [Cyanobium sp. FGCU-52]|nr:glycosyltransferase family 2 protein [Cyanobium sp. FGCU52]